MPDSKKQKEIHNRRRNDQEHLESWKAIAKYLHRSVRTVRRWEGDEGLPIHRHKHASGSSVYAYRAELDAWQNRHDQSLQPESVPEPEKRSPLSTLAAYTSIAFIAAIMGILAGKFAFETDADRSTTTTVHEAWILIAAPVSKDEYRDVGDSLRAALKREVSNSYRVLPKRRIQDALSLMRLDPQTVLSPAIAREVALRDGRVSALLVPRLEQMGDVYVLGVEIIDPDNDQLIAYPSEEIENLHTILPAVERLARETGAGLLLLPANPGAGSLPRVTTSSYSALRLYSKASMCMGDGQPMVAQELLDLALVEDPEFASARALQAWAIKRQGADKAMYLPISREARDLSVRVTPAEQYFIEGSYRYFSGDLNHADASYRALLEIQPDHLFGAHAMLDLCLSSKRRAECVDQKVRLAKLRPDHFEFNLQAAWSLAADTSNVTNANYYADRSLTILRNSDTEFAPHNVARALIFPAISAWSEGDVEGALRKSQQLNEILPTLSVPAQDKLIEQLAGFSIVLGRLEAAGNLLERLSDSEKRQELTARFLFASGDKEGLKGLLASGKGFNEQVTALLMSLSGLPEEAMRLHDDLQSRGMSNANGAVIRASVAFGGGDIATARSELQSAIAELTIEDQAFYFIGRDLLALVLKADQQLSKAIRVLEMTAPERGIAAFNNAGFYWFLCQGQLAQLYREADREDEAILIEKQLRKFLLFADDDFPLVSSLGNI